jgi:hypothetical protein
MAQLSQSEKWRVIVSMLSGDNIDDQTKLVDAKAAAAKSQRWSEPFYSIYTGPPLFEPDGVTLRTPTNAEYNAFAWKILRRRLREIRQEQRGPAAAEAAKTTEHASVATEFTNDFGAET